MNPRLLVSGSAAVAAVAALWTLSAVGQTPSTYLEQRTVVRQGPDGKTVYETFQVPVSQPDFGHPPDAESQKLIAQEQALAQEVRQMAGNFVAIDAPESAQAEQKEKIKEKLNAIFDLQQQRRTREIAKIEERLARLKETLKKRDAAKDEIVNRRLETLTGGIDELGWEESLPPGPISDSRPGRVPTLLPPAPYADSGPVPVPAPPTRGRYNPYAPPAIELPPTAPGPPAAPVPPAPRR